MSTGWMDCKNKKKINKKKKSRWLFEIIHIICFEIWDLEIWIFKNLFVLEWFTFSGWGRRSEFGQISPVLREVHLPIISNQKCMQMYRVSGQNEWIPKIFLCAGTANGGADSCEGDSGGPLVTKSPNGRYDVIWVLFSLWPKPGFCLWFWYLEPIEKNLICRILLLIRPRDVDGISRSWDIPRYPKISRDFEAWKIPE